MPKYLKRSLVFLYITLLSNTAIANPWFTGPILAPSGRTIPNGHTNLEVYGLGVFANGQYDNKGKTQHTPLFRSWLINPILTHGFTDRIDVQIITPYAFNSTRGVHYNHITDTTVSAGLQLIDQNKSKWLPNLRLVIQETIPTGKFEQLNPALLGADAIGLGSYQTQIFLNFQYLSELPNSHYLRTRFSISEEFASAVQVTGLNSFGGTKSTQGTIRPGSETDAVLAFEYALTQNWVAVMEGYYSGGTDSRFNGIWDAINDGEAPGIIGGSFYEYGLTPAIEYNFTSNIGLIGGIWFPVAGKNTSQYTTYVLALNAYW